MLWNRTHRRPRLACARVQNAWSLAALANNPPHHPGAHQSGDQQYGDLQRRIECIEPLLRLSNHLAYIELLGVDGAKLLHDLERVQRADLAHQATDTLPDLVHGHTIRPELLERLLNGILRHRSA